jgi:hypothetical protein
VIAATAAVNVFVILLILLLFLFSPLYHHHYTHDLQEKRLRGRGTETEETLAARLGAAEREMEYGELNMYDVLICWLHSFMSDVTRDEGR